MIFVDIANPYKKFTAFHKDTKFISSIYGTFISYGETPEHEKVKSLVIPEGVVSIARGAFKGWTALESITLPSTLEIIGNYAFEDCRNLKSVRFPSSLTSIGYNAFENCSKLESVTFEDKHNWSVNNESISPDALADEATAANYLTKIYAGFGISVEWKKKVS